MMQLLVDCGAEVDATNKNGRTPLQLLLSNGVVELFDLLPKARILLQGGAKLDDEEVLVRRERASDNANAILSCFELWRRQRNDGMTLTEIPHEVLKKGPLGIQTYLRALTTSTSPIHLHKACVVGPSGCGKTSCIKSLTSGVPVLEKADKRTVGIDCMSHGFNARVSDEKTEQHRITFWDFAGQDVYHTAHSVFFSKRAVYIMVVDLAAYESKVSEFERPGSVDDQCKAFVDVHIVQWLRLIFSRLPDAEIVFIGTKQDLMRDEKSIDTIKSDLCCRLADWCEAEHESINRPGFQSWDLQAS
ncbi:hypothetical protein PINS_up002777 [Pythium insidiosum]|nr:hypothetical protein PINS_up002777 [Pythium insidiosum]